MSPCPPAPLKVHLQCCDNVASPRSTQQASPPHDPLEPVGAAQHPSQGQLAAMAAAVARSMQVPVSYIAGVLEPSLCTYQIVVCAQHMCPLLQPKKEAETDEEEEEEREGREGDVQLSAQEVEARARRAERRRERRLQDYLVLTMETLNKTCMARQEEWWTYELCFRSGLRQYHISMELVRQPDGSMHQHGVLAAEFSLGAAPIAFYGNGSALQAVITGGRAGRGAERQLLPASMPSAVLMRNVNTPPRALSFEYTGGTPCDIVDNTYRAATVEIQCGAADGIIDIVEDRTCHYLVRAQSSVLCGHPDFVTVLPGLSTVQFVPHGMPNVETPDKQQGVLSVAHPVSLE